MSYNRFAKRVSRLQATDTVPLLNAKLEEIASPVSFESYLVDNQFCVGFTDTPISESVGNDEAYYFNGGNLTVPRQMYRLENLTSGIVGQELAPAILPGGHAASFAFATDVRVLKPADQCAGNLTIDHHCDPKDADPLQGMGKTGGGVCGKKLVSNFGYVAELWKWGEVYTEDGSNPYELKETAKVRKIYHYLMDRFGLEKAVPLVSLLLPDNSIVRVPVDPGNTEDVHELLADSGKNDAVYGIDNLVMLDGPDILLGTCTFDPV
ncbi:hypothetical protein [Lewinella sp. IMCC34191]|uniref:hypothetical protein n=1 Tax=Lewinella sp. IMCC34191 TaxID=2259172 RepID=UPI000E280C06|nr:hypothetical protein [Lewinella sp. IMCC34191]